MRRLKEIAVFHAGYPFRGRVQENLAGDARVIQMKDVNEESGVQWSELIRTELPGKRQPDWLKPGDILFVARGFRNYAVCLTEVLKPTVLSPHFFHIRLQPDVGVLPEFLAWFINQKPAQRYLKASAEGTRIPSIRRATLEDMPVAIPVLEKQALIARLDAAFRREQRVLNELSENMEQTMNGLAQELMCEA